MAEQRLRRLRERPVQPPPRPLRFTPPSPAVAITAGTLLKAADVRIGDRLRLGSLTVQTGDRLLISGANGAGKTTLLRVLAGDLEPDAGRVIRRGRVGHLPQEIAPADLADRTGETLLAAFARGRPGSPGDHITSLLAFGLFDRDRLAVPVGRLSTGQRQRLALARLLSEPADVLLLDEPTNHLSLGLVEELEAALDDYPGAVLVVSHDRRIRQRWRGARLTMISGTPYPAEVTAGA